MTHNQAERETIGLCICLEALCAIVNHELLTLRDVSEYPGEAEVIFKTRVQRDMFLIRLLDFVKENGSKQLTGLNGSCLAVLQKACETKSFDVNGSVATLKKSIDELERWLSYKKAITLWLPGLNINATIDVSRLDFLYIIGNHSKHNLSRLTGVSRDVAKILSNHRYSIPEEQIPIVLDDFIENLDENYFFYYSTWLSELLNNVRWGLQTYLEPTFSYSYRSREDSLSYSYEYPADIQGDVSRQWFWRLMNNIRTKPYLKQFVGARYQKQERILMPETVVTVGLGERSYPIRISSGLLEQIGTDLHERKIGSKYGVISDDRVAALYGDRFMQSLAAAGLQAELITFPAGEASKHLQNVAALSSELAQRGFDRKTALIALGGGVTGDITGFLASIYLRGIPFVQVPTTLLSQVDSSVGGKTGVDIPEGKNLVGTFYQPKAVYIDTDVLKTLPVTELRGGLAEVIKYGVINDPDFFAFLEQEREAVLALQQDVLTKLIARCCEIKAWVVEQDEREGGLRRILNFGHTIGHAVEAASGFRLIHGYAVAIGMCAAAELAVRTGCLAAEEADRIRRLIAAYGLPTTIPADLDREAIKRYLLTDKKTVGGRVFYVLPERIGAVKITDQVQEEDVEAVLQMT